MERGKREAKRWWKFNNWAALPTLPIELFEYSLLDLPKKKKLIQSTNLRAELGYIYIYISNNGARLARAVVDK